MFSVTHFRSEFVRQSQATILRKVTMTQFMLVIVVTALGVGLLRAPFWLAPLFIGAGLRRRLRAQRRDLAQAAVGACWPSGVARWPAGRAWSTYRLSGMLRVCSVGGNSIRSRDSLTATGNRCKKPMEKTKQCVVFKSPYPTSTR